MATTVSISGSGKADVTVFGRGTVIAGNGNDRIDITGYGKIVVGSGNDTLMLGKGGIITENGATGHDSIHIGTGNYDIKESGSATVTGAFGQATITGGELKIIQSPGHAAREIVIGGHVTIAGAGSTSAGSSGSSSHDSTSGGASHKPFDFAKSEKGGQQHVINHFVSGQNHLVIQSNSLTHMTSTRDITMHAGQTTIDMHGGKTQIVLHLHSSDISKLGH